MSADAPTLLNIYEKMVLCRSLDDILAQTRHLGNPFYIGSTFEEPLVTVGLQMRSGSGIDYDILSAYYRSLPLVLGMGVPPRSIMQQAAMTETDPFSKGRQMVNHFSEPDFNIMPVSSCVTVEAGKGFASALIQKMHSQAPVLTVVHLGDAMCAEADFWVMMQEISLRELPVLILVSNNGAGIHTPYQQGSAAPCQSAWGLACKVATSSRPEDPDLLKYVESFSPAMPTEVQFLDSPKPGWKLVDGTDLLSVYAASKTAIDYIRRERKPFLLELRSERGRHHSSSSNPSGQILEQVKDWDPLQKFETRLIQDGLLTPDQADAIRAKIKADLMQEVESVKSEALSEDAFSDMYYSGPLSTV
ncbi:hypothetical protein COW36_08720 [bacterium (Candidatus Blackallbacteria) CG17_big_fil_post_rev_8_21_14_2_50_48_46]|uniref:2-oxoisovalerate dehydrogenase subunit alpha n=1 Tax=bacterium (Candidatus Blackallbacteria) CG17_big_fil_post_rev_8_21_14_2_50_48_46 TaxID=2014261 RepID=A0A2M7G6B8_9BACT|nr:MAG: hypothetical protein COW64_06020 [bacterium (Candidatus Blackallbacteria) CG18_big_fil_WC_8_21_14_2_50_49_26]PIW17568.1 MAG: hypothetical protein COW36_08720 [bacterium (Candidatus Blackallbacteria) CG17_big_fil_post_rev_8_21_14_2_50_48_46]PIW48423.1 MAG: hypothetical protein COW20_10070 [bacterium (Candidatus Blackallbacteria) CG13_big_fil_rev_8_21_14_2_50_49_14]